MRGALLLAQNIELATVAVGIDDEEALTVQGVFNLFALNEQAPTVPGMSFTRGVEGIIALDLENVGIDRAVAGGRAFEVWVAAYGGVGGYFSGFPIPFLGGGAEQERK